MMNLIKGEEIIIKGYLKIGAEQKKEQFEKFLDRIFYLTSDTQWNGEVITSKEGMYFTLENARSKFQVFVNCNGQVERKPKNLTNTKKYTIKGQDTEVTQIY
jgi:hypothetical protein